MGEKKGHSRKIINIPDEQVAVLEERAAAGDTNVSAIINADIKLGNQSFRKSRK